MSYKDRRITIPRIVKTRPRTEGIGVCVPAMYWFTNWPKLIEFIEVWRILGATKFYFYYQSVSREVFEVFREYEKLVGEFSCCSHQDFSLCTIKALFPGKNYGIPA